MSISITSLCVQLGKQEVKKRQVYKGIVFTLALCGYQIGISNTDFQSKKLIKQQVDPIIDDFEDDISKEHYHRHHSQYTLIL